MMYATKHALKMGRIRDSECGATLLDFALAAPVIATLLLGIAEIGTVLFTMTLMEGALRDASRFGITGRIEGDTERMGSIRNIVSERTLGLVDLDTASIDVRVYPNFGAIGKGESFVDGNGDGVYDAGETYTDTNENGAWDVDLGVAGAGEAGDVVLYRIVYDWPLLTPFLGSFIGHDGTMRLNSSLAVRNEPWGDAS